MKPKTITLTLEELRPGHEYPGTSINSRTAYRDKEIAELAALLLEEGQLKPLLVCRHASKPDVAFVFDGNRRRAAFAHLLKTKAIDKGFAIEAKDFGALSPEEALRKSWAANEMVPLHPADRYAVFAQMIGEGGDPKAIADTFGMTTRAVEQSLAFGAKLAPEVLDAWRAGEINRDLAQIFTLGDKEDQVDTLKKLRAEHKQWHGRTLGGPLSDMYQVEDKVRRAMVGGQNDAERLLKFVGEETYIAEGGRIVKDLFGEEDETAIVQDMGKLKRLAKKKLEERAQKLRDEGWSWVEVSTAPHFYDFNYDKSKDKKKAGCVVRIAGSRIEVKSGLMKKKDRGSSYGGYQQPEQNEGWKAQNVVRDARDAAAGAVLATNPKLALATLLAVAATGGGFNDPVAFEIGSAELDPPLTQAKTFDAALAEFLKLDEALVTANIVHVIGATLSIRGEKASPLLVRIDQDAYQAGILEAFDAKAYFNDCSAKHLLKCIEEALGADEKRRQEKKGKDALAKFCIASVAPTGWLPAALRTKTYKAPDPKKATLNAETSKTAKSKKKALEAEPA